MKKRPAWITPILLCALGVALGINQNAAKAPDRAPNSVSSEPRPSPGARVDIVSRAAQSLVYWPQRSLTIAADAATNFASGIFRANSLNQRIRALELELAVREREQGQIEVLQREIDHLRALLAMPQFPPRQNLAADIIGFFPAERRISLNVGTRHGVKPGDPVVAPNALVGHVAQAGPGISYVNLITHHNFGVASQVVREGVVQIGIARGQDTETLLLNLYSEGAEVHPDETLTTSGLSEVYPPGIPIGRVVRVWDNRDFGIKQASVEPAMRLGDLRRVAVLVE